MIPYRELKEGHLYYGKMCEAEGSIELVFLCQKPKRKYQCLATNKNTWCGTPSIEDFKEFKELVIQDLPLFINYQCVHQYLPLIIKEGVIWDWIRKGEI